MRLGQPDGYLTGFGIIAIAGTLAVSASGKRRHKAKHGRGEERRQRGLGAQQRELPKLGSKTAHAVADPAAQPRNDAGQAGLRSNTAAKQQRQQRGKRQLAQAVIRVASIALYLGHHLVKVIGLGARHLFVQANQQAAQQADKNRVWQKTKRTAGKLGRSDAQRVRNLGP